MTLTLDEVRDAIVARENPTLTMAEVELHATTVHRILELKQQHGVVVLGHNYMEPLVYGLSEKIEQGDSLGLSRSAAETEAEFIIFNGVRFMAETAKILSPEKRVLIADREAGCSLADNFGATEVRQIRAAHPGVPVMIYVNSYAEAKAECDVCCTSANAAHIAMALPGDELIFVPDLFFAQNLEEELKGRKRVIYPGQGNGGHGAVCEVHEQFTLDDIRAVRNGFDIPPGHPTRRLYVHWECRPEVLREADFYGSTTQISNDIAQHVAAGSLERAFIASECELTSNLMEEFPTVQFWTACSVRCSHMARITLEKILPMLEAIDAGDDLQQWEVDLPPKVIEAAAAPIQRMMELSAAS